MGAALYDSAIAGAFGSATAGNAPNIDWRSDTIKAIRTTSAHTPAKATHDFYDDLTNIVGSAVTLANTTLAITTSVIKLDADDAVWAADSNTARNVHVYDDTPGTNATKPLIHYHANASDVTASGGEWRAAWHANGIVSITVAAEA